MSRRVHIILDLAAILFYCAAIFYLSSLPMDAPPAYPFPGFDKLLHVALFGGLGLLVCRFLARDLRRSPLAAMLIAATFTSLYGLSDEIHQLYVKGRFGTAGDFAANTVGAILAVVLWYYLMRPRRRPSLLILTEATQEKSGNDVPV